MYIYVHVSIFLSICVCIYPVTHNSSDAYVKRQGYKLPLFGGGGGTFVMGPFFKNTLVHSDLRVKMLSGRLKKCALLGGFISVSLELFVTWYIYINKCPKNVKKYSNF